MKVGNKRVGDQEFDQELTRANAGLASCCYGKKKSCPKCTVEKICASCESHWKEGQPVRVIRCAKETGNAKKKTHSKYSPEHGCRYDGVYKVVDFWFGM